MLAPRNLVLFCSIPSLNLKSFEKATKKTRFHTVPGLFKNAVFSTTKKSESKDLLITLLKRYDMSSRFPKLSEVRRLSFFHPPTTTRHNTAQYVGNEISDFRTLISACTSVVWNLKTHQTQTMFAYYKYPRRLFGGSSKPFRITDLEWPARRMFLHTNTLKTSKTALSSEAQKYFLDRRKIRFLCGIAK
jgi:hypothetical protein